MKIVIAEFFRLTSITKCQGLMSRAQKTCNEQVDFMILCFYLFYIFITACSRDILSRSLDPFFNINYFYSVSRDVVCRRDKKKEKISVDTLRGQNIFEARGITI